MNGQPKQILSASRRTDIPAFYLDWFMASIDRRMFNVEHPFTRQPRNIPVSPESFHSIVFWSKNFKPFLDVKAGDTLVKKGFHLYFNFTLNSESALESGLPSLKNRLSQFKSLADIFGPETISWRFDPICFFQSDSNLTSNNLTDFKIIADAAHKAGIQKCVTSFFDPYRKIEKRLHWHNRHTKKKLKIINIDTTEQIKTIRWMSKTLYDRDIDLYLCCEHSFFSSLDSELAVKENACIDGRYLKSIFGGNPETKRDTGQRTKQGCRCTKSVDIGSYSHHPCFHNCLFCYANPDMDRFVKNENQKLKS